LIYQRLLSRLRRSKTNGCRPKHWNRVIPKEHISSSALRVLSGLQDAGFIAYLVGGGVRDLLVGKIPKDFDVATDASPEQVRRIFRNSRIIGRRFLIVHVFYHQEIIEVSTFRAQINQPVMAADPHLEAANNVFGTIEEDAWRRDFTVNSLYYNPDKRTVVDYTGGIDDLEKKLIRIIGDPAQRFHEDPVRLLRAIRLSAKLQFQIHADTEDQLRQLPNLLQHVAKSRLFDEMLKLFFTGHAQSTYLRLSEYNYLAALFPQTVAALSSPSAPGTIPGTIPSTINMHLFIELAMQETDRRYQEQSSLNPGFLLAVLLWPAVQKFIQESPKKKFHSALRHAIEKVLQRQVEVVIIPYRLASMMRAIWILQYYLTKPRGSRVYRTLFHRYFRAAFDFLTLRVQAGEQEQALLTWWAAFREADAPERKRLLKEQPE